MMSVVEEDLRLCLKWAVSAKKSKMNQGGFTSNLLIFIKNQALPNLLGIESSSVASREVRKEGIMRKELDAMHKAREIFIETDSCKILSLALNKRVRE